MLSLRSGHRGIPRDRPLSVGTDNMEVHHVISLDSDSELRLTEDLELAGGPSWADRREMEQDQEEGDVVRAFRVHGLDGSSHLQQECASRAPSALVPPNPENCTSLDRIPQPAPSNRSDEKLRVQPHVHEGHTCLLYTSPSPRD